MNNKVGIFCNHYYIPIEPSIIKATFSLYSEYARVFGGVFNCLISEI